MRIFAALLIAHNVLVKRLHHPQLSFGHLVCYEGRRHDCIGSAECLSAHEISRCAAGCGACCSMAHALMSCINMCALAVAASRYRLMASAASAVGVVVEVQSMHAVTLARQLHVRQLIAAMSVAAMRVGTHVGYDAIQLTFLVPTNRP